jgi:hypothetical protein
LGGGIWKIRQELLRYPEIELMLKEVGYAFQVQFIKKTLTGKADSGQSRGRVGAESKGNRGGDSSFKNYSFIIIRTVIKIRNL